jgi:glutathione S-transferase
MFFDEFADTVLANDARGVAFNRFIGPELLGVPGDEAVAQTAERNLQLRLDWLEGRLPASGWLAGEDYSLADLAVASCLKLMLYGMELGARPRITQWYASVCQRAAWQAVAAQEKAMIDDALASGAHRAG